MKIYLIKYKDIIVRLIYLIAVITFMAFIFNLSSQPVVESVKLSTRIANGNIKAINKVIPNTKFNLQDFNHMLRKNAHFFVYLILSILVINLLRRSAVVRYKSITLLICVLYAISDEVHQVFVFGRTASINDILIDSLGSGIGIFIYLIFNKKFR